MAGEIRIYYEGHVLLKSGFEAFCRDFGIALKQNTDAWKFFL
jgi:hypothetical protein